MAGLSSYEIAAGVVASGGSIDTLTMGQLSEPVNVDWRYLFGAGIIMVLALWFSKKAKNVTKTEVNLSRQGEGIERFSSTSASRSLVRNAINISKVVHKIMPQKVADFIESRFLPLTEDEEGNVSFDMIRASVNLTVSALLISAGTSLKLPLSTTYVTFMVAMGSSLADRAWGRESAVYRITGVLTVISGWFLTAFVAFTVAALVAFGLMYGGIYAVVGVIALVVFMFIQFMRIHKKREKREESEENEITTDEHEIVVKCTQQIEESVATTIQIYQGVLDGLFNEDRKSLLKLYKIADELHGVSKRRRAYDVLPTLQRLEQGSLDTGQYYVQAMDYAYEISVSLRYITESSYKFIDNAHEGFSKEQIEDLKILENEFLSVYGEFNEMIKNSDYSGLNRIKERRAAILDMYAELVKKQIKRTKDKETSTRNSILYLNILNETKVIAMKSANLMRAQMNLYNSDEYNMKRNS
jgi:Na+/phosphate symporter